MKKITAITALIIILFGAHSADAQKNQEQLAQDFQKLSGKWTGSLTYLDYSSGKPYTMAADIEVKRINDSNEFEFINTYPKEKSANSTQIISISQDGKYIGKEEVISRTKLAEGQIQIVTQRQGKDGNDNKEALIKQTYTISGTSFSTRKEVLFSADNKWILRHEYVYSKK
ncbi:hypothetical protein [Flavobacterium sp. HTF]|uniref:hypothetical protein n=1 Tax=Flavobacterium sp. HTF TaxID=2170732 RepID=UPI000F4D4164|nr:hypothetical protein [Flavobacterium sp. HTF]